MDPTPYALRGASGQVGQAMDVANSFWREYVVEMHGGRDSRGIGELGQLTFWERIQATVVRFRAGQFGESTIEYRDLVSWRAALIAMGVGLVLAGCFFALRILWQRLRRKRETRFQAVGRTSVDFFAILMRLLARGKRRQVGETPRIWVASVLSQWQHRGHPLPRETIDALVEKYYQAVYGGHRPTPEERIAIQQSIDEVRQAVRKKPER
jgi:hypothetical protein